LITDSVELERVIDNTSATLTKAFDAPDTGMLKNLSIVKKFNGLIKSKDS
jgi:hypothetical protein